MDISIDASEIKSNKNRINLRLGDVIRIIAPTNDSYDNKIYYIDYIDEKSIKIINKTQTDILYLGETGELTEHSIKEIHIIKRSKDDSFTKLNNLTVDKWIDIKFNGDIPLIVTAFITNVIEDMIEVKTFPSNDVLFIDFAYRGIPQELNIEYIKLRDKPISMNQDIQERVIENMNDENMGSTEKLEGVSDKDGAEAKNSIDNPSEEEISIEEPPKEETSKVESVSSGKTEASSNTPDTPDTYDDEIPPEMVETVDEVEPTYSFEDPGELLGMVTQYVNVAKSKQRFTLEDQKNDLLDVLSESKKIDKTIIYQYITRFEQLRAGHTVFDDNENPVKAKILGNSFNASLELFMKGIPCALTIPVTSQQKNIYDFPIESETTNNVEYTAELEKELQLYNNYDNKIMNYHDYMNNLNISLTPYTRPNNREDFLSLQANRPILSIIDNDDLYNTFTVSTTNDNTSIKENKYITQMHITPIVSDDKVIMTGEHMDIKSIITLPFHYGKHTNYNLYKANILERVNKPFINMRQILNKKMNLQTNLITQKGDRYYDSMNMEDIMSKTTEHILDDGAIRSRENFDQYLKIAIPNNTKIVKYVVGKCKSLSFYKYLQELEPFNVSASNMHFTHYKLVLDSVYKNVDLFWKAYKRERKRMNYSFSKLQKLISTRATLMATLGLKEKFENRYLREEEFYLSNSEVLAKALERDNATLFVEQLKLNSRGLVNNIDINFQRLLKETEPVETNNSRECSTYKISKKYDSMDALNADNGKEIFFDKYYDDTVYDILNVYKVQRDAMNDQEFLIFLENKLIEVNGIDKSNSKSLAKTMMTGKKKVETGDYAILQKMSSDYETNELEYYSREDEKWVYDEEATNSKVNNSISINNKICEPINCTETKTIGSPIQVNYKDNHVDQKQMNDNLTDRPIQNEFECSPSEDKKQNIRKKLIMSMMEEYKHFYAAEEQSIEDAIETYTKRLDNLINIAAKEKTKYQSYEVLLGSRVSELNNIKSPYIHYIDDILAESNGFLKHKRMLEFIHKYTRASIYPEDKYWYYCKETNAKLLPTFYFKIAVVVVQNKDSLDNSKYVEVIRTLYKEQGKEEDGNIVDMYSGEVIASIDFDKEEGFDEFGHKVQSRSTIQPSVDGPLGDEEAVINDITNSELSAPFGDETGRENTGDFHLNTKEFILHILYYISSEMNIDLGVHKEYVVYKTITIFEKHKNKKNEEYTLVLLTIAMYFIAVQMYFPKLTGKYIRVNDCKASFKGYPLHDESDFSGIEFFACFISKRKKQINKRMKQSDENKVKEHLITMIKSFILDNIQDDLIDIKRQQEEKEQLLNIFTSKNLTFLPPLTKYEVPSSELQNHLSSIKSNIKRQATVLTSIDSLKSKNIIFSYGFMQTINNEIAKEDYSLQNHATNEFYLENSCCSMGNVSNIIDYIGKENSTVYRYLNIVRENEKYLDEIRYFPVNYISKEKFKGYRDEKYESYTNKTIELFFENMVKEDEYEQKNVSGMLRRLNDVYGNSKKLQISQSKQVSYAEYTESLFRKTNSIEENPFIAETIKFVERAKETKEMKDIIISKLEILEMFNKEIKSQQKKYTEFTGERKQSLSEQILKVKSNNAIQILKNKIRKYCFVFPSILMNKYATSNYSKLPKHWNLSKNHYSDLRNLINENYVWLDKYYGKDELSNVVSGFIVKYKQYETVINHLSTVPLNENEFILDEDFVLNVLLYVLLDILNYGMQQSTNETTKKLVKELLKDYKHENAVFEKTFDLDMELLQNRVLKSKEREKDRITRKLKNMNDAEREISKVLKENKLGDWNIGEQKGLRIYDKNFRDVNRPEGEDVYLQRDMESEFAYTVENEES
jgi:hypothetical protein